MEGEILPQSVDLNTGHKKLWASLLVIILVVGGIFAFYFFSNKKSTTVANPPVLEATAESGKLVGGFPGGLILARGAIIVSSEAYGRENKPGASILSTVYDTSFSMESLKQIYANYAKDKNYQILRSSEEKDSTKLVMKAFGLTTISIWDLKDKRQVSVVVSSNK